MTGFTFRRKAARVVLLDPEQRVFLIHAVDPADPRKPPWWEIPGGGMDPGESSADTARRELFEEAGITGADIGPCIWAQHVEFDFGGFHFDQDERIHIAWCAGGAYDPQGLESLETVAFTGGRWWTYAELASSDVALLPSNLRDLLPPVLTGDLPATPIDIGT